MSKKRNTQLKVKWEPSSEGGTERFDGEDLGATLRSGPEDGTSPTIPHAKERPIIFSGPMIRAILEGRKTQTRRIVKPMAGEQSKWLRPETSGWVPHGTMINGGWQMHHPKAGGFDDGVFVGHDWPFG